jgi:hypothetical protein
MSKVNLIVFMTVLILILSACVTDPGDPSDINSGNPTSSDFFGPVINGKTYEVTIGGSVDLDLRAENNDETIMYQISMPPKYGTILGAPPFVTYFPYGDYLGQDLFYYSAINFKGQISYASIIVTLNPRERHIYISPTGSDSEGEVDDPFSPFQTAQRAVDVAIELSPTQYEPVYLNFSEGSFGNVEVSEEFGAHVYWRGAGSEESVIGDFYSRGVNGDTNENGTDAPYLIINSDMSLAFQNIVKVGGLGGDATLRATSGGSSGSLKFKGKANYLSLNCGYGLTLDGDYQTGSLGSVTLEENSLVREISVAGYPVKYPSSGGEVIIYGEVELGVIVSGGNSEEASGGAGGIVWIMETGIVGGDISLTGGNGVDGGRAGRVEVYGRVFGDILAIGGESTTGFGGDGGEVVLRNSSRTGSIFASGGHSTSSSTGSGGRGGYVTLIDAEAQNIVVNGGNSESSDSVDSAGNGGAVVLEGNSSAQIISANGGNCDSSSPGSGGQISYVSLSTFEISDSEVSGGTCSGNSLIGEDGDISQLTTL